MKRKDRLNSLLKEVIAEVIMHKVRNPKIHPMVTVQKVEVTQDLHQAKVYVSLIGSDLQKKQTLLALKSASGFISTQAAKEVNLRYFPSLTFYLDDTLDTEIRIHQLLEEIYDKESVKDNSSGGQ